MEHGKAPRQELLVVAPAVQAAAIGTHTDRGVKIRKRSLPSRACEKVVLAYQ